jgi:hypothetical protein
MNKENTPKRECSREDRHEVEDLADANTQIVPLSNLYRFSAHLNHNLTKSVSKMNY